MNIIAGIPSKADNLEDTYPLSPLQHGMLMHALLKAGTGVDIEQFVLEIREALDLQRFRRACQIVADRHPVLRTSFCWDTVGGPQQEVRAGIALPWDFHNWQTVAEGDRDNKFADLLRADRNRGFDLACPPLWRLTIVRFCDVEWRVVWTYHHSIVDGRALALLL